MASGIKKTNEEFITEANKIHNYAYDYSRANYKNNKTHIEIICHKKDRFGFEHGSFFQTPHSHIDSKCGCPKCKNPHLCYNQEEFIIKASITHQNKFDYSDVIFTSMTTDVKIKCKECGETFLQKPYKHLGGKNAKPQGCPFCVGKNKTTPRFIKDAQKIHGKKYNYSKTKYIDAYSEVCIICPEHGEFWQTAHNHLKGGGCPICAEINRRDKKRKEETEFIKQAIQVHGKKYDYSKVEYLNCKQEVCIICPEHGEFWQTPDNHLQGKGCKMCASNAPCPPRIKRHKNTIFTETKYKSNIFVENNINIDETILTWLDNSENILIRGLYIYVTEKGVSFYKNEDIDVTSPFVKLNKRNENISFLYVEGNCIVSYNDSKNNLSGSPNIVNGNFVCSDIHLTSFEGMPAFIGGIFDFSNNELTDDSWEYAKNNIDSEFGDYKLTNNYFVKYRSELY